ncbi:toluene tolerance protein [Thalassotalea euphylliae]|uniref:Toluene tolerance protein n=1 Tax=Thalassotalea euphylliae TaxID=1655234 RepID=A0A3E0TM97_9GAMM|nr:ABC transporter substrate-binding protein [Thalassotalea euphylliae]REL25646.1 toluene tolerance protein [Thalassotalea euphylliae]
MRNIIQAIQTMPKALLFTALLFTANAHADISKTDPYAMIQQVADITFKRVKDEQAAIRSNPNLLKKVVREELLPYVDYRYAAYKVIGKNLKKTTEQERKAFVPVFRDYLVTSYAQVFTLYNDQTVEFEAGRKLDKQKIVAVKTRVLQPGGEPIDISFKVRKNRKKNEWKAFDMIAEGISLLDSKQAELSSIIRQKGLPHVTEMLKEKAERDVVFKQGEP